MFFSRHFRKITHIKDTDEQLRSHILWFIFIRVVLFTLLLGITFLLDIKDQSFILPPSPVILAFIIVLYCYSIASALLVRKFIVRLQRFGLIQLLSDTVFTALLVYATGCSQSIFTAVFILPIIAGGLILYRMGGLIPASAATILYGSILIFEYLHYIPRYYYESRYIPVDDLFVSMNVFAVYGLTFFLIAILSGMLAQRLRKTEDALTRTELELDRLLLLYKQIFDDIITGIITVDEAGYITSFNPAAENITGYSKGEMIGRRLVSIYDLFASESVERQVADLQKKNGDIIRIGYSCSSLHLPFNAQSDELMENDCQVITLQDISQVEDMERQVRRAEKMAAIGELSASIAHDFRNPLAAISGSAQILAMEIGDQESKDSATLKNLSNIIMRESDRMARTISDFLHYARPMTPAPKRLKLFSLAQEAMNTLQENIQDTFSCRINLAFPEDMEIYADEQLLLLTLSHLLKNSCYASRHRNVPVVLSAFDDVENNQVIIEIKDKGEGIANNIKEKLFDPFFSTREDTAGLGLAIVKQIMNNHGGTITINGIENEGCTVQLTFPKQKPIPE